MPDLIHLAIQNQISAVEWEIALRKRVYSRFVSAEKMSLQEAERKIEVMNAVLSTLRDYLNG